MRFGSLSGITSGGGRLTFVNIVFEIVSVPVPATLGLLMLTRRC